MWANVYSGEQLGERQTVFNPNSIRRKKNYEVIQLGPKNIANTASETDQEPEHSVSLPYGSEDSATVQLTAHLRHITVRFGPARLLHLKKLGGERRACIQMIRASP
ncbi:hypothetical protein T265_02584 [Opisthorchis viverrini]|uniref:Uncharacterized protein n=1 Tax=Opisthorchis viverrini TaxID=6198 RepID=A0A075AI74_OPIVI|nr:hypothetical protein T265_02584 [Opisthorchis viverrini]KER31139.1 hypothetical protein T265_02584 [Opisthorchis viverrini]